MGCASIGCGCTWTPVAPVKQIYRITSPNGKIYVGSDLTGDLFYLGSPSAADQIGRDLGVSAVSLRKAAPTAITGHGRSIRVELLPGIVLHKRILWESRTATDSEVRALEVRFIKELGANNPAVGYNKVPKFA
jgi:hypothetical protein